MKGRYPKVKAAQLRRAAALSAAHAWNIGAATTPQLAWLVRVSVPFSYAASRNHVWTSKDRDHVSSRARSRVYRAELATLIRGSVRLLRDHRIASNKLWIDILVQKPNHKGDAVNVVDLVCDAVKDATGLDDRWYCIRRVDWQIVKHDGRLFVGVGQESLDDAQACATCGRLLALDMFASNRANKRGRSRVCHDCRRVGR